MTARACEGQRIRSEALGPWVMIFKDWASISDRPFLLAEGERQGPHPRGDGPVGFADRRQPLGRVTHRDPAAVLGTGLALHGDALDDPID